MIVENERGSKLVELHPIDGDCRDFRKYQPLTASITIATHRGRALIVYDRWKKHWELPGGTIEKDESPEDCAKRELQEEVGQKIRDIYLRAIIKLRLPPKDEIAYAALFIGELETVLPFKENSEIGEMMLWDGKEEVDNLDAIVEYLISHFCATQ